ncbi:SDR family NAD(P)-dependent oxidoreductase [Nocardioides humi]|uniref:SDR family oxidoreductase n=1 Tax=Nocardioides humi TaxID=449461 RepID=A0ABN2A6W9_9ACTN|nr:SDR family oxidoreductase [Nocardioides humi]
MSAERVDRLDGRCAVVTGSSAGIGRGIAESLVRSGADVVLSGRTPETLAAAVEELRALAGPGQQVLGLNADLSQEEQIDDFFDRVRAEVGRLDILVANIGGGQVKPFFDLTREDWTSVFDLNLLGPFLVSQRGARLMRECGSEHASITLVSSIRAHTAKPGRAVYASTKAAMNQLMRVMARELAPFGIRVNALLPGITDTPLTRRNPEAFAEAIKQVPLEGAATPADMGRAVAFLASDAARFITGQELAVDGGELLHGD